MNARFFIGRTFDETALAMKQNWTDNFRSPVALLLFLGTAAMGITADLWTKSLAVTHLKDGAVIQFIPGLVHFTYTENHGAVFGIAQGARAIFLVVSVGAICFLLFLFMTSGRARIYQFILGMLLAGVIGNMYDRILLSHVRDMIYALPDWHWPAWVTGYLPRSWQPMPGQRLEVFPWIFNVADMLLCVGVAAMLLYSFIVECHRKRAAAATERAFGLKAGADASHPCLDPTAERS